MKKESIFLILLLLLLFCKGQAQEVISSAGAHGTSASQQLSWTIGEPVVETASNSSIIPTQGFHQRLLTVTAIDPFNLSSMEIRVSPNPTVADVTLSISKSYIWNMQLTLVNSAGKVLLLE